MAAKKSALDAAIDEVIVALQNLKKVAGSAPAADSSAESDEDVYDRADVEKMPIKELRALAVELGLEEQKVKSGILDEMEANGLFADSEEEDDEEEFEDEDEADEDDDEDESDEEDEDEEEDDEEEDEGFTREELEGMSLAQLRKLAKEEGHTAAEYRKLDQDALVDLLAGDEEDGDEDEEEDEEEIDEDTLRAMDLPQLKKVAAELELKVPVAVGKNKNKLVNFILENAGEEDDE